MIKTSKAPQWKTTAGTLLLLLECLQSFCCSIPDVVVLAEIRKKAFQCLLTRQFTLGGGKPQKITAFFDEFVPDAIRSCGTGYESNFYLVRQISATLYTMLDQHRCAGVTRNRGKHFNAGLHEEHFAQSLLKDMSIFADGQPYALGLMFPEGIQNTWVSFAGKFFRELFRLKRTEPLHFFSNAVKHFSLHYHAEKYFQHCMYYYSPYKG